MGSRIATFQDGVLFPCDRIKNYISVGKVAILKPSPVGTSLHGYINMNETPLPPLPTPHPASAGERKRTENSRGRDKRWRDGALCPLLSLLKWQRLKYREQWTCRRKPRRALKTASMCLMNCRCQSRCWDIPQRVCPPGRGLMTACRSQFFSSTVWVPGVALRTWDLATWTFPSWAVSSILLLSLFITIIIIATSPSPPL